MLKPMHPIRLKILEAIKSDPEVTVARLKELTGCSTTSQVDFHLKTLVIKGFIKRVKNIKILKHNWELE